MELLVIIVVWLVLAALVGVAAEARGRDKFGWMAIAAFASPLFAGLILAIMPSLKPMQVTLADPAQNSSRPIAGGLKKCPDCAELVQAEARICRFCRHEFDPATIARPSTTPFEEEYKGIRYTVLDNETVQADIGGRIQSWSSEVDFFEWVDVGGASESIIPSNPYRGVPFTELRNGMIEARFNGRARMWDNFEDFRKYVDRNVRF
ncbi:MAG TPA: hypothetical protein VHL98_11160 [Microvirga sp.]|jgi:hypothetical protein|nr:hypothetical protein [Microvirga sp.]